MSKDGWIKHRSTKERKPPARAVGKCLIRFRNEEQRRDPIDPAGWRWSDTGHDFDIAYYKPV